MRRGIRLTALALCLLMLAGLCSCVKLGSDDPDTPDGMQIASAAGADFMLYVPTTWVLNTAYGISGAYRDLSRQSTVSVVKYPLTDIWRAELDALAPASAAEEETGLAAVNPRLTWFFENECLRPVKASALDGKVTVDTENSGADMLDKLDAGRWCYSALVSGTTYRYKQLITERNGAFYVFTFTANEEMYENYASDIEKILNAFRFVDEPYYPKDFSKVLDDGADAPEGMKACFGADVAYKLYVPSDWEIDLDSAIYAAYVKDDHTSVSVVPYMPTVEHLSVAEYWEMVRSQTEKLFGADAMQIDEGKTHKEQLGSREATVWEYTLTIGGVTYRYRQYIAAYRSMIYSLTYTATAEQFDGHTEELDRIVAAFSFR